MAFFLVALIVLAGFAGLLWQRHKQGRNVHREASFFVDVIALTATALLVGALATLQLRPTAAEEEVAVGEGAATATAEPEATATPAATRTPRPTRERPSATPTAEPSATAAPTVHIIVEGETLEALAIRYGTTIEALLAANSLSPDSILSIGQEIIIPLDAIALAPSATATAEATATLEATATPEATATEEATATPEATATRRATSTPRPTTQAQATATRRATSTPRATARTTATARASATPRATSTPRPTVTPVPPTATAVPPTPVPPTPVPPTTITYTVVAGDTLRSIATRFGVTTTQIINANPGLTPDNLQIGQVLRIPRGSGSSAPPPSQPSFVNYTVVAGDTLRSIATRFGVTTTRIINANPGLTPDNLQIGQVLRIPR